MNVWQMVKNRLPFFGTRPFLRMSSGSIRTSASSAKAENALYAWSARLLRSARKRMRGRGIGSPPGIQRLGGQGGAVGGEEDARPARRLAAQVPAGVEQVPGDLERDEGLARAGGEGEEDAIFVAGDRLHHAVDGDILVIASLEISALVLE